MYDVSLDIDAEARAKDIVNTTMSNSFGAFYDALNDINEFVGKMGDLSLDVSVDTAIAIVPTDVDISGISAPSPKDYEFALTPRDPSLDLSRPSWISDPTSLFEDIAFPSVTFPEFLFESPGISFPECPEVLWPSSPGDAPAIADVEMPSAPAYSLPDAPTLSTVDLPTLETFTVPTFEGEDPGEILNPPGNLFIYSEDEYSSALQTEVYNKLLADLATGGTGLGADVETALWQRGRDRLDEELERGYEEIDQGWAQRGFSFPPGMLLAARQRARDEIDEKKLDLDRDITVEQARLAREQSQFIVQQSIALEQMLITNANAMQDRAFQAARATAEFGIAVYEAYLSGWRAKLEKYRADGEIFKVRLEGELARLEKFKVQMEGAKIEADIQQRYVELYKAQLQGVQILTEIYKTEVDSARVKSEMQKLKIEIFAEEVRAYIGMVQAGTARYDAYQTQVQAALGQAQIYSEQVSAYKAQIDAKKSEVEASGIEANTKIAYNQQIIEKYKGELQEYATIINGYTEELKSIASLSGAEAAMATAQVAAESARLDSEDKVYATRVAIVQRETELKVQKAIEQSKLLTQKLSISNSALDAAIKANAQVASSAIAAFNTSVSYGYSGSESNSSSTSTSNTTSNSSSSSHSTTNSYITGNYTTKSA